MKKYIIEVEETKAEIVANLLVSTNVKISKLAEEKKHYVKIEDYEQVDFLCLTEEQFSLLQWLMENDYFEDWTEVDPSKVFEEV